MTGAYFSQLELDNLFFARTGEYRQPRIGELYEHPQGEPCRFDGNPAVRRRWILKIAGRVTSPPWEGMEKYQL
jgi:hypothetical protein